MYTQCLVCARRAGLFEYVGKKYPIGAAKRQLRDTCTNPPWDGSRCKQDCFTVWSCGSTDSDKVERLFVIIHNQQAELRRLRKASKA